MSAAERARAERARQNLPATVADPTVVRSQQKAIDAVQNQVDALRGYHQEHRTRTEHTLLRHDAELRDALQRIHDRTAV